MRILLITPSDPSDSSSGSLMLLHQAETLRLKDQLFSFVCQDPLRSTPVDSTLKISRRKTNRLPEFSPPGLSGLAEPLRRWHEENVILPKVLRFARQEAVEALWVVLQGRTMINLTAQIMKELPIPVISQVWDDPKWILDQTHVSAPTKKALLSRYQSILKGSSWIIAPSPVMAKEFSQVNSHVNYLIGSLPKDYARPGLHELRRKNKIIIGFAGQLYAKKEWQSLLRVLNGVKWQIEGKTVEIYLIGRHKLSHPSIKTFGYLNQKEVIDVLRQTDIAYCPYWLDPNYARVARTSFPSKLTSYLAAGRPVLFHGPNDSSPADFIKKNDCGVCCDRNGHAIINSIEQLIDRDNFSRYTTNARQAYNKYLTMDQFTKSWQECLNYINQKVI